jgi:hypothetical protein
MASLSSALFFFLFWGKGIGKKKTGVGRVVEEPTTWTAWRDEQKGKPTKNKSVIFRKHTRTPPYSIDKKLSFSNKPDVLFIR